MEYTSTITTPIPPAVPPSPPRANEKILKHFTYTHLPPHLAEVSKPFHDLAHHLQATLAAGPERSVAMRKLLEAKDAAVRAMVHPGG